MHIFVVAPATGALWSEPRPEQAGCGRVLQIAGVEIVDSVAMGGRQIIGVAAKRLQDDEIPQRIIHFFIDSGIWMQGFWRLNP